MEGQETEKVEGFYINEVGQGLLHLNIDHTLPGRRGVPFGKGKSADVTSKEDARLRSPPSSMVAKIHRSTFFKKMAPCVAGE